MARAAGRGAALHDLVDVGGLEGPLVEQLAELLELVKRQVLELLAGLLARKHHVADDRVGLAEGHALAHEVISQVGGGHEAAQAAGTHVVAVDAHGAHHARAHVQGVRHGVGCVEDWLLVLLHVLVVGQRDALHGGEQAHQVAVDAARLAARELGEVGVLLLRHDGGAGGVGVVHCDEAELVARPVHELLAQARQVHLRHRAGVEQVEEEVAVAHRVHGVLGDAREAQLLGHHGAVERVGGAGQGGTAQGAYVGRVIGVAQAAGVAREHPVIGQHMVAEEHRLGLLHVGVARHDHAELALGALKQHLAHLADLGVQLAAQAARDEAVVEGHLVVAGAARVKASAGRADALGQRLLHRHVDVLVVDVEVEVAGGDVGPHLVQAGADGVGVGLGDDAHMGKHLCVGLGALDVLGPHALVKGQRRAVLLEELLGLGLEASAPEGLVGGLAFHALRPPLRSRTSRDACRSGACTRQAARQAARGRWAPPPSR